MKAEVRRLLAALPPSLLAERILHPERFSRGGDRLVEVDHDRQHVTVHMEDGGVVDEHFRVNGRHSVVYGSYGAVCVINLSDRVLAKSAVWFEEPPLPKKIPWTIDHKR